MKKNSVIKRSDCEKATVHYAIHAHNCVLTRRAIKTQFQSVDFFACDVVGKRADGSHVYIQATAGQSKAVLDRKKKLEEIPWHKSDTVELVQLVQTPDPANARKTLWFFKIHVYSNKQTNYNPATHENYKDERVWVTTGAIPVPKEWFLAYKTEEEKKAAKLKKEKENEKN